MSHFAVFGTHPRLSLAELHAAYPNLPTPLLCGSAAVFEDANWDGAELMLRLGGTVKLGDVIATIPTEELEADAIIDALPKRERNSIDFGCTLYGGTAERKTRYKKLAIEIKRAFKARSIPSRWVTGEGKQDLSPAAVSKLKLTSEGYDICVFLDGTNAHIGLTTHVQDADAWSLRDYGRPARDDKNGMLPPKLARMLVNLASVPEDGTLLDPFCGSGTVLMEAALATRAARIVGSDNDRKQIADTEKNLTWLMNAGVISTDEREKMTTFISDARQISQHLERGSVSAVASEGYLGPALHGNEPLSSLKKNAEEIAMLWQATLKELKPLLAPNARLACVWPAFKTTLGVARVDLTKDLDVLGYALVDPFRGWDGIAEGPLLYHRVGQHVMRRVVLIEPK